MSPPTATRMTSGVETTRMSQRDFEDIPTIISFRGFAPDPFTLTRGGPTIPAPFAWLTRFRSFAAVNRPAGLRLLQVLFTRVLQVLFFEVLQEPFINKEACRREWRARSARRIAARWVRCR